MKKICVFCGSNVGKKPEYLAGARALGQALVANGIGLVYGGASVGLMGAMADEVLQGGGEVIGIMPRMLVAHEVQHKGLTDFRVVDSMHERKAMMHDLSDAFVAMPGGFGTLDEFCEVLTWYQIGIHTKPMGILNVNGYYDSLLKLFDHGVREGFMHEAHRQMIVESPDAAELIARLKDCQPASKWKWHHPK